MCDKSVEFSMANADSTSQLRSGQPLINDSKDFLSVFPEELWVAILDEIKDPETLENLSIASPVFRRLLLSRRVEFLFPKVFPFLAAKLEIPSGPLAPLLVDEKNDEKMYHKVLGIYKQDYKLRRVCSTWNKTVQTFRESHFVFSCLYDGHELVHFKPFNLETLEFDYVYITQQELVERFLKTGRH